MHADNDHVQWLEQQARRYKAAADKAPAVGDANKAIQHQDTAEHLAAAADTLQQALAGINAEVSAGNRAISEVTAPGQSIMVVLMSGGGFVGQMGKRGRYDFIFETEDGRRLVIAKHAVAYYELQAAHRGGEGG